MTCPKSFTLDRNEHWNKMDFVNYDSTHSVHVCTISKMLTSHSPQQCITGFLIWNANRYENKENLDKAFIRLKWKHSS